MRALTLIALLCCAGACGDDASPADAGAADANVVIDAPPDAAELTACETLCNCMTQYCSDGLEECMTRCESAPPSVQTCWIQHCGYAQTNPSTHCPHARGEDVPGVPEACLLPE